MAIAVTETDNGKLLEVRVAGKLAAADYERFVPVVERLIQRHGKIDILLLMEDFHGWEAGALWEDIKFDLKHFNDIERLAMVGENKWQEGMSWFCRPFTTATIRYFDLNALAAAKAWLQGS